MAPADAIKNFDRRMSQAITIKGTTFEIRSEAHGPHWIAWIAKEDGRPERSVVMVGQTKEEAERRVRHWAEASL